MSLDKVWNESLERIEGEVGAGAFELWFKPLKLLGIKNDEATLEIPNRFFKDWIDENHPTLIKQAIMEHTGRSMSIKFRVAEKVERSVKRLEEKREDRKAKLASRGIYLNPRYTFESFVLGKSNEFARAASMKVAESPGLTYNPLFIYGGVGLGKTHLLCSIGNSIIDNKPLMKIIYISSEQFTNEVVHAIRHGKTEELKRRYRNSDVLLMDDVQFMEGKTATQEELFHTLNALYEKRKQIVLTSDRPPKEIITVTDRLRSRFSMGLIADIQPPDIETKKAIIYKKLEAERINLPEDVVHFLATKITTNIRELEGCLIRLAAHASLTGSPIDLQMAKTLLRDIISDDERPLTPDTVLKAVAAHYGIKVNEMKARKRTRDVAVPRQVAMYISREITEASLSDIGKAIGGKDHATVIYACKKMAGRRASDEDFDRMVESLINQLKP